MKKIIIFTIYALLPNLLYSQEYNGLPQFDTSKYSQQIFWFIIIFSTLYVIMHFLIVPRIRDVKNDRKSSIHRTLEKALKKTKEVEKIDLAIAKEYKHTMDQERAIESNILLKIAKFSKDKNNLLDSEKKEIIQHFNHEMQSVQSVFNKNFSNNKIDITKLILQKLDLKIDNNKIDNLIK